MKTSRTSVIRLRDELLAERSEQNRIAAVNRARSQACAAQEAFESVGHEFRELIEDTKKKGLDREMRATLALRAQMLGKMSLHLHRQLRGAGVIGLAADRALEQWDEATQAIRAEVIAEEEAARDGKTERFIGGKSAKSLPNESDTAVVPPDSSASPEVARAYQEGLALEPCAITAPNHLGGEAPEPPSHTLALTEAEQAYAAGYAQSWGEQIRARVERTPGDDAALLERTVAEIQFQKEALRRRHFEQDAREHQEPGERFLSDKVSLTPEAAVPEPWSAERSQREAWRLGALGAPPRVHEPEGPAPETYLRIPLSPDELAWCAGAASRAAQAEETAEQAEARFRWQQEEVQLLKWHLYSDSTGKPKRRRERRPASVAALDVWAPAARRPSDASAKQAGSSQPSDCE